MRDKTKHNVAPEEDSAEVSQNSFFAYLDEISQYKLLSVEEEVGLFERILNGDNVAKDLFIKSNLRLVVREAKKYHKPGYTQLLDLIQDGNIGLLRAVERYDPTRGCKFSTFAVYHINKALQNSSCRTGYPVTLPESKVALVNKIRFAMQRLEIENGVKPSFAEIAQHIGVSVDVIIDTFPFVGPAVSLQSKLLGEDDDRDRELGEVFSEYYGSETSEAENMFIIQETREEIRRIIREVLNEKEAYIIFSKWGLSGYKTKDTVTLARELGMTKQGVQQSEARSMIKLKRHLANSNLSMSDFI